MATQEDAAGNIWDDWNFDPNLDSDPGYNGSVQYPNVSGGTNTQTFDDGSTLTVDSSGNVVGSTNATVPVGSTVKSDGTILDSLGRVISTLSPLSPLLGAIASPYINNALTGGLIKDAQNMVKAGGSGIANIKMPDLMAMIPQLQLQVQQGTMSPAQATAAMSSLQGQMTPEQYTAVQAVMQGKMTPAEAIAQEQAASGMKDVVTDQETLRGARTGLGQLADIAEGRGMTEADRAAFAQFMNQQSARTASDRAAQIQQMQMQGNAGTGSELAARLAGVQGGANTNALAGANMAQAAQARALQAIQGGIQGNTALNAQLFGQDASKAQAQDLVNQFNAQAKNAVSLANAGFQQQSDLANFQTANQMALANQAATNNAGQFNAGARQSSNLANFNMANQIAMQNAQNQQAANIANAGFGQQSNLANFQMGNDINRFNTGILNQQALLPLSTANQQFQNSLNQQTNAAKAQIGAGTVLGNMANQSLNRSNLAGAAATTGATTQPVATQPSSGSSGGGSSGLDWGGIVNAGVKLWNIFGSDENMKTGKKKLVDSDVDEMMANLTGYKYRYRGDKSNPEQTGVMAQDLEKGMPDSVVNTPAGKFVQKPEALSHVLAVLANNNERIRKLEGR